MGYLRIIGVCRCLGLSLLHSGNGAMVCARSSIPGICDELGPNPNVVNPSAIFGSACRQRPYRERVGWEPARPSASDTSTSVFNTFADFALLILPMFVLWNSHMPLNRKGGLIGIFLVGSL